MSKALRRRVSDESPSLPEDLIAEILSRLPVESLLRLKCVCKKWRQFIHQDDFVQKHHRRAATGCYEQKNYTNQFCSEFCCIDIQKGLLLEQEHGEDPTGRLRIRNPATMQTVYLPELRVGDDSPTWLVARMFFVAKSINECTVISFSESEESFLSGRFRAITVGVDATWRPLENFLHCISQARQWAMPQIFALSIENIFHVVTMDRANDRNILSVNAEDENIKTLKIPENLFSYLDWGGVMPGEWDSNLCLFCNDDSNQINIRILLNNNKNEWVKTQVFNLATLTLQDNPISYITVRDRMWRIRRWVKWCRHKSIYVPWRMKEELSIKPSILQLKGMQSEMVDAWKEIDKPIVKQPPITWEILSLITKRY
nr:putative F-box domain-containing protein [Ipomoea batatas]GMD48964.1 putative F-box domain-containing protein [Ipomoea batatas]